MLARLMCIAGLHQWDENHSVTKTPFASDDGMLLVKVIETTQRFCVTCTQKGGVSREERYELWEDHYGVEEEFEA